jgi:alkylation response protein AidB-like acyl-CoA dehydrogenase
VGIAATERHGGSRLREITTAARSRQDGDWLLSGEKCWVSRLDEAVAFVVFFRAPGGDITAALVPQDAPGLHRRPARPAGLAGWSWGALELVDVVVVPEDLVGAEGDGLDVFDEHFSHYRPLVTMTALGAAAGVHAAVSATLRARTTIGIVSRPRDTAMIALGRSHIELNAALLTALATITFGDLNPATADLWARSVKAFGIDSAYRASCELPLLIGALGFTARSHLVKARNDLAGLLYADGIHDSLYRSAGRMLFDAGLRSESRSPDTRSGPAHGPSGTRPGAGRAGAAAAPGP